MSNPKPVPTLRQSEAEVHDAKALALSLLEGVGEVESGTRRERLEVAWHARRKMTPREVSKLSAEWCSIPPVDRAGAGEPW